jgi:hypothetical protein
VAEVPGTCLIVCLREAHSGPSELEQMARVGSFTIGGVILSQRKRERILRNDRERTGGARGGGTGKEGSITCRPSRSMLCASTVTCPSLRLRAAPDPAQIRFDGFTQTTTLAPLPVSCFVCHIAGGHKCTESTGDERVHRPHRPRPRWYLPRLIRLVGGTRTRLETRRSSSGLASCDRPRASRA